MKRFYTKITPEFKELFIEAVGKSKGIVITAHISPDDDSISSVLAVYYYLVEVLRINRNLVKMVYLGDKLPRWNYFENYKNIDFAKDLPEKLEGVDVLIMLDGSGWKRVSKDYEKVKMFRGKTICIDHHPTPEDKFDLHLVLKDYSSTAEIIYKVFLEKEKLSKSISETLLMGIIGDTGGFRFIRSKNSQVLSSARELINKGKIDVQDLESKYQRIGQRIFSLITKLMQNTSIEKISNWPTFQFSYLDRRFLKKGNYKDNEISTGYHIYLDQYMRKMIGVDWGFAIVPKGSNTCGVSLRSLPGSVNVRLLAENSGIGGGHDRASGGKINIVDPLRAKKELTNWMNKNKPVLD